MFRLALFAIVLSACGDDAHRRPLGATCAFDDECAVGICGAGRCIDPSADDDGDGLDNALEVALGTNPAAADSDNDGLRDGDELDAQVLRDSDGDGRPDVLESIIDDADGDCIPDQLDGQLDNDDAPSSDLAILVEHVCRDEGVCAAASTRRVTCDDSGPKRIATCVYDDVPDYEADESTCDGRDNDCDGATDEASPDLDDDTLADCIDDDDDGDGVADADDRCPSIADDQADADDDGAGDACDAPQPPVVTASDPVSPATDATPTLIGSTTPGASVEIFAGTCDTAVATGTADASGTFAIAAPATNNDDTRFHLRATNGAGLASACIPSGLPYVHDDIAPNAPTLSAIAPSSPSTDESPRVSGSAEANARIELHTSADCTGLPLGAGTADTTGTFVIAVTVANNTATTIRAAAIDRAGNRSSCAVLTTYVHDGERPTPPSAHPDPFTPTSPSSDEPNPIFRGCADADAIVDIYSQPGCLGPLEATLQAEVEDATCPTGHAFFGLVAATPNATTTFFGQRRSANGRISACVPLGTYLHDGIAPSAPTLVAVNPSSPSDNANPAIIGRAEPGVALSLHLDGSCAVQIGQGFTDANGDFIVFANVNTNELTPIHARATDTAGNTSACTFLASYTHDDSVPVTPSPHPSTLFTPASPSVEDTTPLLRGCAAQGADVAIFTRDACLGAPVTTLRALIVDAQCPTGFAFSGAVTVPGPSSTTTFRGRTTNDAGVQSACATLGTYELDMLAPAAPVLTTVSPPSPAAMTTPTLSGTAEVGSTVSLYRGATCTEPAIGTATSNGTWTIIGALEGLNTTTRFWARAVDRAGNASNCTSLGSWVHDDLAPRSPTMNAAQREAVPQPSNSAQPLRLCSELATTVRAYTSADCSGTATVAAPSSGTSCGIGNAEQQVTVPLTRSATIHVRAHDAAGNRSDCVALFDFAFDATAPAPPTLTRVLGTSWTFADPTTIDRVTFAIAGQAEPGASVAFVIDGLPNGTATADADGRFEGVASNVAFAIAGERRLQLRATDPAGNASALTPERAIIGAFTLTTTLGAAGLANVATSLQLPDGTELFAGTTNAVGAFNRRIFAGMMVTIGHLRPGPPATRMLETWADLMPGDDLPLDLAPPAATVTSTTSPVQFSLPTQNVGATSYLIQASCGIERRVTTTDLVVIDVPETCARVGDRIDILVTALRADGNSLFGASFVVAYAFRGDVQLQPQSTTIDLGAWLTETTGTLASSTLTVLNDTPTTVRGVAQSFHQRGDDTFSIAQLVGDGRGVALSLLPGDTTTVTLPFIGELGPWRSLLAALRVSDDGIVSSSYEVEQGLGAAPISFGTRKLSALLPLAELDPYFPRGPNANRPAFGWYVAGPIAHADALTIVLRGDHNCVDGTCDRLFWRIMTRPWDDIRSFQVPVVPNGLTPVASWSPSGQTAFTLGSVAWVDFDFIAGWDEAKALGRAVMVFGGESELDAILPEETTLHMSFATDN